MTILNPYERIFVALDTVNESHALDLARALKGQVGGMKIGKEFFTACGLEGVRSITNFGIPLFLDLKFHDIPNTVAGALKASLNLSPKMVNVHTLGGETMMRAAAESAKDAGLSRPLVLGVTILTSLDESDLNAIGISGPVREQVIRLSSLAKYCGLDGVVCSAIEVKAIREELGVDFKLVVPGIRPKWSSTDDQKRTVTPAKAVSMGADYLVIGRPITASSDPVGAVKKIVEEIGGGV